MNRAQLLQNFDTLAETPEAVAKLRKFVLDLAIRGSLLTQNQSDEPASKLLAKIHLQKQKAENGSAQRTKTNREQTEIERPFTVPDGWEWANLSSVSLRVHYGYTASAIHEDTGIRLLRITDIQDGQVNWESVPGCQISDKDVPKYELHENDVLIARTGGTIGKSFLVRVVTVKAVFASYLIRVIPSDLFCADYLNVFLSSSFYWEQLRANSAGTGQPNVNGVALSQLWLPIPPPAEQRRIVAKVEELLALCDELETQQTAAREHRTRLVRSALDHLTAAKDEPDFRKRSAFILQNSDLILDSVPALRQAIRSLAVQGRLVSQDAKQDGTAEQALDEQRRRLKLNVISHKVARNVFPPVDQGSIPMRVPVNWKWIRLGEVTNRLEYGTSEKAVANAKGVPTLRMGNIHDGKLDFGNLKYVPDECPDLPKLFLENEDIIFNRTNSAELVGKAAVFRGKPKSFTLASYLIRVSLDKTIASPDFFNLAINSGYYRRTQIEPELTQQCGQANFSGSKLANSVVPLPPLAEQHRIVAKVDELMRWCDALEAQLAAAQTTAAALLDATLHKILAA